MSRECSTSWETLFPVTGWLPKVDPRWVRAEIATSEGRDDWRRGQSLVDCDGWRWPPAGNRLRQSGQPLLVRAEGRKGRDRYPRALGASSKRIAKELFSESLVLAVLGSLLGLGLAYGALRILIAIAPPDLPRLNEIAIDGKAILFTLAVSVAALLLFGSAPALITRVLVLEADCGKVDGL